MSLADALAQLDGWVAPNAAAAVVTFTDGVPRVAAAHGAFGHVFGLASVTKPIAAYATLLAAEEGAVELGDPAEPGAPGATVEHLLAHASGIGPEGGHLARAGTRRIYSNAGFELLGGIVAAGATIHFPDYVADGVLAPLGMSSTAFGNSPAHGATSTVDDLVKFVCEVISPRLLGPSTVARATSVAFPGLGGILPGFGRQQPNDWGLGFEVRGMKRPHWTAPTNSPSTFGHFGQAGTFFWIDPAAEVALICLTDHDFGPWATEAWPRLSADVLAAHAACGLLGGDESHAISHEGG